MTFTRVWKQFAKAWTRGVGAGALGVAALIGLHAAPAHADGLWQDVQKRGTLRCAYASAPPYQMKDLKTGEYGGAYLDLCKQFADVLKVKVEFVDTTWDNIVAGLQAGKWDLSPSLNRTPNRALAINYSGIVGYDETNFAYLKANEKVANPATDLSTIDLPTVRVGVMSGSAQDHAVTARLKKAQIVRLPDANGLNLALLSGRVDVAGADSTTNLLLQTANPDKVLLLEAHPALMRQGISYGLAPNVAQRDIDVLNIFLEEKIALGVVDDLMKHWSEVYLAGAK
ncbi:transporter substrate-binding domain-containing protein [Ancylobacter sp. Lp-2]|uniref:substrate-binding periplasmic protein n=1 Tax=Ancylobacter sp. Lp-2 TaxID=2881339 RepID=UPI001E41B660|nr:transporter substrate-binding domain-containing protein [Ancylobacter sp. Lp-2]MCB4769667.1 transporter substrate-binding domain-containing protein [Ancylobacter sp. Lp-2]